MLHRSVAPVHPSNAAQLTRENRPPGKAGSADKLEHSLVRGRSVTSTAWDNLQQAPSPAPPCLRELASSSLTTSRFPCTPPRIVNKFIRGYQALASASTSRTSNG